MYMYVCVVYDIYIVLRERIACNMALERFRCYTLSALRIPKGGAMLHAIVPPGLPDPLPGLPHPPPGLSDPPPLPFHYCFLFKSIRKSFQFLIACNIHVTRYQALRQADPCYTL